MDFTFYYLLYFTTYSLGMRSTLVRSPVADRKVIRREGVAERNEVERRLAKEAVIEIRKISEDMNQQVGF